MTLVFVTLSLNGCDIGKLILTTEPWHPPPSPAEKREPLPRAACNQIVSERQALFGDLHLHTALSMDANALGTRTLPNDAYAFAKGEPITLYGGAPDVDPVTLKIERPLAFAAGPDHAQ